MLCLKGLLRRVVEEAGRRGRSADVGAFVDAALEIGGRIEGAPQGHSARPSARPRSISLGQARIIRAAFDADVKPATIARQYRVSRHKSRRSRAGPN